MATLALGCAQVPPPEVPLRVPLNRIAEEQEIYEAIFRYRMAGPDGSWHKGIFLLHFDGVDPPEDFLARFARTGLKVGKSSHGHLVGRWYYDRRTGQRATALGVGATVWISPTQVQVPGGMYCGTECADGGVYYVLKTNGRWAVTSYRVDLISSLFPGNCVSASLLPQLRV